MTLALSASKAPATSRRVGREMARSGAALAILSLALGCERRATPRNAAAKPRPSASAAGVASTPPSSSLGSGAPTPSTASSTLAPASPAAVASARPTARLKPGEGPWLADAAADIGPAGPASAHELGVVMVDRKDALFVARRGAPNKSSHPETTRVEPLDRPREDFAPYGRGPGLTGGFAYWVSQNRLVRRKLDGSGALEVLASDARKGTRVAAAEAPGLPPLVAYVTTPDSEGTPHAKLWTAGGSTQPLTADGAGTSSIAIAAQKSGWLVATLDGRSAMTPLHVRRITPQGSAFAFRADVVTWVGASAQGGTEVFAAAGPNDDAWAFVAIEQDVTHFGLAAVQLGHEPRLDSPVDFTVYPNGLNTAPVAAATVCGQVTVAFAQPGATADAEQELMLAQLGSSGLGPAAAVAHARAFADCSLAAVPGGALLAYTAGRRTWAVSLRCR